tara:strand:- start:571 stop:831 length:261 start_codon:yes stop_codon:yes gene_type:complete
MYYLTQAGVKFINEVHLPPPYADDAARAAHIEKIHGGLARVQLRRLRKGKDPIVFKGLETARTLPGEKETGVRANITLRKRRLPLP